MESGWVGVPVCILLQHVRLPVLDLAKAAREERKRDPDNLLGREDRLQIEEICTSYLQSVLDRPPVVPDRHFAVHFRE